MRERPGNDSLFAEFRGYLALFETALAPGNFSFARLLAKPSFNSRQSRRDSGRSGCILVIRPREPRRRARRFRRHPCCHLKTLLSAYFRRAFVLQTILSGFSG